MAKLFLKIVCPDGEIFSSYAKSILVTTTEGEVQILAGHADFIAPLATGRAKLVLEDGSEKTASVSGGFILVSRDETKVVATTFEFAENIDIERAIKAKEKAEQLLKNEGDAKKIEIAEAKLARAISRINVASN